MKRPVDEVQPDDAKQWRNIAMALAGEYFRTEFGTHLILTYELLTDSSGAFAFEHDRDTGAIIIRPLPQD